jgi:hypothetical protein
MAASWPGKVLSTTVNKLPEMKTLGASRMPKQQIDMDQIAQETRQRQVGFTIPDGFVHPRDKGEWEDKNRILTDLNRLLSEVEATRSTLDES